MTFCNARTKCTEAGVSAPSSSALFEDFQQLQAIWTHPFVLKRKSEVGECTTHNSDDDLSDDDHSDDASKCSHSDSETDSEENGKLILDLFL